MRRAWRGSCSTRGPPGSRRASAFPTARDCRAPARPIRRRGTPPLTRRSTPTDSAGARRAAGGQRAAQSLQLDAQLEPVRRQALVRLFESRVRAVLDVRGELVAAGGIERDAGGKSLVEEQRAREVAVADPDVREQRGTDAELDERLPARFGG